MSETVTSRTLLSPPPSVVGRENDRLTVTTQLVKGSHIRSRFTADPRIRHCRPMEALTSSLRGASDGWLSSALGGVRREGGRDSGISPLPRSGERWFFGTTWEAKPGKPQRRPLHPLRQPPPPPEEGEEPPPRLPDPQPIATNDSTALNNFLRTAVEEATTLAKELVPISPKGRYEGGGSGKRDNIFKAKMRFVTLLAAVNREAARAQACEAASIAREKAASEERNRLEAAAFAHEKAACEERNRIEAALRSEADDADAIARDAAASVNRNRLATVLQKIRGPGAQHGGGGGKGLGGGAGARRRQGSAAQHSEADQQHARPPARQRERRPARRSTCATFKGRGVP